MFYPIYSTRSICTEYSVVDGNRQTVAIIALIVVFVVTGAKKEYAIKDGTRLMDNVGPVGLLPQVLAALGAVFTAAGVGDVIAKGIETIIPDNNRIVAVIIYCLAMALFK